MRCSLEDISFEVPDGWRERRILVLSAPRSFAVTTPPNIVVVTEELSPTVTLVDFGLRYMATLGLSPRKASLQQQGGLLVYHAVCDATTLDDELEVAVSFVQVRSAVFYVSTSCSKGDAHACHEIFHAMLASMRFGEPPETQRSAGPSSGVTSRDAAPIPRPAQRRGQPRLG